MACEEGLVPILLLELRSTSSLSATRTQVVCTCAEVTQRWMWLEGLGVLGFMRDEAAVLLEPCGMRGHFPIFSSFLLPERGRAGKGINEQKFSSFLHRPRGYSVCLPRGDRSGYGGNRCFLLVGLPSFARPQSVLFFVPPGDDDDPSSWVVPWRNDKCIAYVVAVFP